MRVLLGDMPLMLKELLTHALARDANAEIINEPLLPRAAPSPLNAPDLVIGATADSAQPGAAPDLLERWPRSQVLMIATDGHHATLYELQPRRTRLGEMSIEQLLGVVARLAQEASRRWDA
jgi:hypothetical protein